MIVQVRRTIAAALALALFGVVATPSATAAPHRGLSQRGLSLPVVGTVATGETFAGTMTVTSFAEQDGQVVARGIVTGILTDTVGAATTIVSAFALPVSVAQTSCQILHLDLGPLFLDLLGLQVDLSRIVLDITAQAGAGNLLGNLLCAVVGLLDDPTGLARLLDRILDVIAGL
jgi:hypothetical protein